VTDDIPLWLIVQIIGCAAGVVSLVMGFWIDEG
jgi:hypothetical protein